MTEFPLSPAEVGSTAAGTILDLELILDSARRPLALTADEAALLTAARGAEWTPTVDALERLGRLTNRRLEALSAEARLTLDPHEAAGRAWRIVIAELDAAGGDGMVGAVSLESAVNAFTALRAHADREAERTGADERDAADVRDKLARAAARLGDLEAHVDEVLAAAASAGGLDAMTGRYETLGVALTRLEAAR